MYFIEKTFNPNKGFSAVFRQPGAASHCRLLHGYDLIFSVMLGAHHLDANNWVFDFGKFDMVKQALEATFDHKLILAEDDPHLALFGELENAGVAEITLLPQVGCEAFARWFFYQIDKLLHDLREHDRVFVVNTKVYEHGGNMAGYAPNEDLFGGNNAA